jgi:hypothetical protein
MRVPSFGALPPRPHGDGAAELVDTALQVTSESCCSRAEIADVAFGYRPRGAASRPAEIKPIGRVG